MDTALLFNRFARIGARLKFADRPSGRTRTHGAVALDVRADRRGEFFEFALQRDAAAEIAVLDAQPADRHLLLLIREGDQKSKFLCGNDERHWFVAAIPEAAPVGTVRQAKEALKPTEVISAQARNRLGASARDRRKYAAFVRHGEWFFLPALGFVADERLVLRWEPLRRGGGKAPWAEFLYRTGGESVHVCPRRPNGSPKRSIGVFWPVTRGRRRGAGARCDGIRVCTSGVASGTPTTPPSHFAGGIGS